MTETRRRSGKLRRRAPNIPRSGRQIPSTPRENGISVTVHRLGPSGAFDQDPAVEIIRKSPPISHRFSFPHHPCDETATRGAGEPGAPAACAAGARLEMERASTERDARRSNHEYSALQRLLTAIARTAVAIGAGTCLPVALATVLGF